MNRKTVCFTCKHLKLNTLQGFALKYAVCVKCLNIVIKATYYKNTATVSGWLWHLYYGVMNGFSNSSPYQLEYLEVKCQMYLQANMWSILGFLPAVLKHEADYSRKVKEVGVNHLWNFSTPWIILHELSFCLSRCFCTGATRAISQETAAVLYSVWLHGNTVWPQNERV